MYLVLDLIERLGGGVEESDKLEVDDDDLEEVDDAVDHEVDQPLIQTSRYIFRSSVNSQKRCLR